MTSCGGSTPAGPASTPGGVPGLISAGPQPSSAALPTLGIYGGSILLPRGSGYAALELSTSPLPGAPALPAMQGDGPTVVYIGITAHGPFSLASLPGFNLTEYGAPGSFFLSEFTGGSWNLAEWGWESFNPPVACFATNGPGITLQSGQTLVLAVAENMLASPGPKQPACPQSL